MKLICTKFGLLYHNTCLWNSKCLFFYEYFAFSVLKSCRITENFDILRFISAIQQTDRIIMTVILQTRQASRHFTIQKFCKNIQKENRPRSAPETNGKDRSQKEDRPPSCSGGRSSTAKRGTCKHMYPASDRAAVTSKPLTISSHYQKRTLPSRSVVELQYKQPSLRNFVVNSRFFDQIRMCFWRDDSLV